MPKIYVSEAPLWTLGQLNRLFVRAVDQHFAYFPPEERRRVVAAHSVPKLALAAIDPRRVLLIARQEGRIIGYCIGAVPSRGPAQIYWLYVEPDFRGQNTGLTLLSRMLKAQAKRGAREIAIATHDHRRYYERQGFKYRDTSDIRGVPVDILTFTV
jgi:GNAT superfamily N-acetyltransferase